MRGSVNRSFRAISLAQYEYSNYVNIAFDNNGDSVVTPFLPIRNPLVQSAFGIDELEPETSIDFSVGITGVLGNNLSYTVDAYQIDIDDRILISGGVDLASFPEFEGSGYDEVQIFSNAVDTRTKGIDVVLNYTMDLGNGLLTLALAANYNETEIEGLNILPGLTEGDLVDGRDLVFMTDGAPKHKAIMTAGYQLSNWDFLARVTNFGEVKDPRTTNLDGKPQTFDAQTVTDLSVTGRFTDQFSVTMGVNNVFDVYPDMLIKPQVRGEVIYSRRTNQFGTMGRFINLSMTYRY